MTEIHKLNQIALLFTEQKIAIDNISIEYEISRSSRLSILHDMLNEDFNSNLNGT